MQLILRSLGVAVAALITWSVQGQICYNTTLFLTSNGEAGPSAVSATLTWDGIGEVASIETPLPEGAWQETFCLYPGCYTLAVIGNAPLNPEFFQVGVEAFGGEQEVDVVFGDATNWYTFCVNPEVMQDCPASIDFVAVEGCHGTFEIGSFEEGEQVVWNFGDGSDEVVGGHFAEHVYEGNGEYDVTAWYTSSACPDGAWLEAVVAVTGCGGDDCPESIEYLAVDGCLGTFEVANFVEGESVVWDFLDGTDPVEGGHFIQHEYAGNGTYDVIASYSSSLCPDGVELVGTVEVTNCGGCTFEATTTPLGCGIAQLNAVGLPEGAQPNWYLDGAFVGSGMEILVDGLAPEAGVECYAVTGYAELECGLATANVELCAEACGGECPLEMDAVTMDGMWWNFTASGPAEGTALDWFIDGNYVATTENGQFEAGFDFNPYWEVCVAYASGPCEGLTEACFDYMGGSGCPNTGIEVAPFEGCGFELWLGDGNPNAGITWSVDGEYIEQTGSPITLEFPEGGEHEISAYYVSTGCPGESYFTVVDATGCGETACNQEAYANQQDCDSFVLWASGVPEGSTVAWTLDGEPYEAGLEFAYTVTDMECHVFAFTVTSGACEGEEAEVQICPTACNDCASYMEFESLAEGVYQFTAFTADGELYTGPLTWWFGPDATMEGNPVAYTWFEDTPEITEVCASFPAWEGCESPGELCAVIEPVAPGCEEVSFTLDASVVNVAEVQLIWAMAAEVEGLELGGLDTEGAWNWLNEGPYEVSFCLPYACYDMELSWANWPVEGEGVELFSAWVAWADQILPLIATGTSNGATELGFGWADDCLSLSTSPAPTPSLELFPNPTSGLVRWSHPADASATVRVLDQAGRAVWAGSTPSFDTSEWAPGLYFVELSTRSGERLVERLVVVR